MVHIYDIARLKYDGRMIHYTLNFDTYFGDIVDNIDDVRGILGRTLIRIFEVWLFKTN